MIDVTYNRFCFVSLTPSGLPAINAPATCRECPFEFGYKTHQSAVGGTGAAATEDGFSLTSDKFQENIRRREVIALFP